MNHAIVLTLLIGLCSFYAAHVLAIQPEDVSSQDVESGLVLDDFNDVRTSLKRWITVNDNVMGGRSEGGPSFADGLLTFKGATNTNGGGFSSIRTRPDEMDLSGTVGLALRVKGDGRTYMVSLRTDVTNGRWQIPFRAEFETVQDKWVTVFVPYEAMQPTFWGQTIRDNPPVLELDKVQSMGLMIYDKQDGDFELQVDWIKALEQAPPRKSIRGE